MRPIGNIAALATLVLASLTTHAQADPWDPSERWGIGIRTTSLDVSSTLAEDNVLSLEGGGLQVRFRLSPRWEFELTSEAVHASAGQGDYVRDSTPVTLSALLHMRPEHSWDWYFILGLGGTESSVQFLSSDGGMDEARFQEGHVHFGVGLERRFGNFGIAGELRLVAMSRDDEQLDGPRFAGSDGPIPVESSGAQFNLAATYYF